MNKKRLGVAAGVLALAACGGGGGSSGGGSLATATTDVVATGSGPALPVPSGTTVVFTAMVVNSGAVAALNVSLSSSLSTGLTAGTITCVASGGAACPATLGAAMSLPSLPSGGSVVFTVPASVALGSSGAFSHTFAAGATNDAVTSNNTAVATATVYSADVTVTAVAPPAPVPAGSTGVFSVIVGNAGPDASKDLILTTTPGAGLTAGAITCVAAGGAVCPATLAATTNVASLPKGGTLTLAVPAMVVAGTNGPITLAARVAAAGDPAVPNNTATASGSAYSANVSVSLSAASAFVAAGSDAVFTGTLANAGPGDARDLTLSQTLTSGFAAGTVTCAAAGGASCPATLAGTASIPVLPVGGTLTLTIPVPVGAAQRGAITESLALVVLGDPVTSNNASSATTTARDPRTGDYKVYATNSNQYTLTADFDAATVTVAGIGSTAGGSFSYDAATGWYVVSGNSRFRVATDLLVGALDFGAGPTPFVAARKFVGSIAELAGTFNQFTRQLPAAAANDSFISAMRINGSNFELCNSNIVYSIENCPAASVATYPIVVAGDVFTATVSPTQTFDFRMAVSGTTRIILRAGPSTGTDLTFRIALPNAGFGSGTFYGSTTAGLRETVGLSSTSYVATRVTAAGSTSGDSASLLGVGVSGPTGMRQGARASDGAGMFLMQVDPLAVVVGARSGPAAGYLELLAR